MAIINSVAFGKARKTAGNVVFYDRLGQTVARQKNLTPTNPNTYAQVAQRILITNPSRSYRSIVDATRTLFAQKFFDYSFGRSYLATKRRTAYNEFFFRAMLKPYPAFLSKLEVTDRLAGVSMPYELAQGSLNAPALDLANALADYKFRLVAPGQAAGLVTSEQLDAWALSNGYVVDANFKVVILVQFNDQSNFPTPRLVTLCAMLKSDGSSLYFDALGSGLELMGEVGKIVIGTAGVTTANDQLFPVAFAVIPFGVVNTIATSANVSMTLLYDEGDETSVVDHTTDMAKKALAIQSYSPSTPAPIVVV